MSTKRMYIGTTFMLAWEHIVSIAEGTNNHIKDDKRIKFCFADSNGNLKVKFTDNRNVLVLSNLCL